MKTLALILTLSVSLIAVSCQLITGEKPTETVVPAPTAAEPTPIASGQPSGPLIPQPGSYIGYLSLEDQKVTLDEAAPLLGITVPLPGYLPKGYKIQEIYAQAGSVTFLVSDVPIEKSLITHTDAAGTIQRYDIRSKLEIGISWYRDFFMPVKIPDGRVDIEGRPGWYMELEDKRRLIWNWQPSQGGLGAFEIGMEAQKGISKEEMVKIGASIAFEQEPEIYAPKSKWIIADRLYDIDNGKFSYLRVHEDGELYAIEMEKLNEPVYRHVKVTRAGKLDKNELDSLVRLFTDSNFQEIEKSFQFEGRRNKDGSITTSNAHYGVYVSFKGYGRFVRASGYFSTDGGKTYPDMPYPLNEIYARLKTIADTMTEEVAREKIDGDR